MNLILQIFDKGSSGIGTGEPVTWDWRHKGGRDIFLPMLNVGAGWDRASMSPPDHFISGKESRFPFCRMRVSKPSWTGVENLAKYWPSNPKPSARIDTLSRLGSLRHMLTVFINFPCVADQCRPLRMRAMCHDSTTRFELIVGNSKAFSYA